MFDKFRISGKLMTVILFLVSAAFIITGILGSVSTNSITSKAETTYAKITDVDSYRDITVKKSKTKYTVYVDYMVCGKDYTHVKLGTYNSPMTLGEHIEIYYDSDDPSRISDGKQSYNFVPIATGVVLMGIAIFKFIKERKEEEE